MDDLLPSPATSGRPVECLGQTFPSDCARRDYFLGLLAEKLKDPEFRKIEGFPIGSDQDILALSDPPYYTACPNPWIGDFIARWESQKPPQPEDYLYHREPFAADVSEGKNDPIYNAHSYHTKVPFKSIMRYILHYTQPGDIVCDGFCGTGMTGVAAQMCGDRRAAMSLGYKVQLDGTILHEEADLDGRSSWRAFSKLGTRKAVLSDLSPAATFIAHNYNTPIDVAAFEKDAKRILGEVERELGWMYETSHDGGTARGKINYTVWSDVFVCPECSGEVVFWEAAIDKNAGEAKDEFNCPHCNALLTKRLAPFAKTFRYDSLLKKPVVLTKQVPVLLSYTANGKRYTKAPDEADLRLIHRIENEEFPCWAPSYRMMHAPEEQEKWGDRWRAGTAAFTHVHHLYTTRNLRVMAAFADRVDNSRARFLLTGIANRSTRMNRIHLKKFFFGGGGWNAGYLKGAIYTPSLPIETSIFEQWEDRLSSSLKAFRSLSGASPQFISTESSSDGDWGESVFDYIFIDPPFGANLNYSELSFLWESWLRVWTNNKQEIVESSFQNKTLSDYRKLMSRFFAKAYRALRPGRWITIVFSNTNAAVWNSIQTALSEAGLIVANVSALDKKQGSFNAVTNTTSVKQDLVISAYKPGGGLEERFSENVETVWDFVRTHLAYLPVVKRKGRQLEYIVERDPRIIFDRMVAWFVRHSSVVPLSSPEFQEGLRQRFPERDGMVFLPEQVTEYDRKRAQMAEAPQIELFVADERSAIDWLTDFLRKRPSTYQEVHPEFITQLGAGWRKHEAKPELSQLLEDNFLRFDGKGDVPSQIHSYLSTSFKDLRGLEKSDSRLVGKAKERWYVPDTNKGQDLERKRERALLKEFEVYRAFTGRRLKEFRLEALRAGFKHAWGNRDYQTIIKIAQKIPEEALQEDEKLLLWYDQALTRSEADG